jgi:DNA (cytosine-5)-methyltransferase 1
VADGGSCIDRTSLFGDLGHPVFIDLFAGGGGASLGAEEALGFPVFAALNHDGAAIEMHQTNHRDTRHYLCDVWSARPEEVTCGRPVLGLWASPDCKHFSKAKGGKPRDKRIRGLAWVVCRWAALVRPRMIFIENVEELTTWGPLTCRRRRKNAHLRKPEQTHRGGKPVKARAGETFRLFVSHLRALGYVVDWRILSACDFGVPTSRRRLYMVARRDGQPIVWPEPTHGPGLLPYRTAASCIDWNEPMCSILATPDEAKAWAKAHGKHAPQRPLKPATLRRIAEGVRRYLLDSDRPFLLHTTHDGRLHTLDEPVPTVTAAHRGELSAWSPMIAPVKSWGGGGNDAAPADRPLRTVTTSKRGEHALVAASLVTNNTNNAPHAATEPLATVTSGGRHILVGASLIETGNGERAGQAPRTRDVRRPLGTITAQGSNDGVACAFLAKHNGSGDTWDAAIGQSMEEPLHTVTARDTKSVVAASMVKFYGTCTAADVAGPAPTVTANGKGGGHLGIVAAHLQRDFGASVGAPVDGPMPTVTAGGGGHTSVIHASLTAYYGSEAGGQAADEPLRTVTATDRFGLLSADLEVPPLSPRQADRARAVARFLSEQLGRDFGEFVTVMIAGVAYVVVDIAMRMLTARELARAQGFPDSYVLTGTHTEQVARIGNSVCKEMARRIIKANVTGNSVDDDAMAAK